MRTISTAICCLLLFFAGIAGAESTTGARNQMPPSASESGPPLGPLFIPSAAFREEFNDIGSLEEDGWVQTNNSEPLGGTVWFQGNPDVFAAHSGPVNAYAGANYNSTGDVSGSIISNWLILPEMGFRNGDEFAFWTRTTTGSIFPDRLELRISTSGDSVAVGEDTDSTGDFDTRLLVVNESLATSGYPETWRRYTLFLQNLPADVVTDGRLAFRYYVTEAGSSGSNSNYIGIDTVSWLSYQPGISVVTTAGTAAGECGPESSLELDAGSDYYLCQTITNDGNVPLTSAGYTGPEATAGALAVPLAAGASFSWIDGPFTAAGDLVLDTGWQAGNPERHADPQAATSTARIFTESVTSVTVTPDSATLLRGQEVSLSASLEGRANYDATVTWASSDTSVATVSAAGVVTAVEAGSAVISATSNQTPAVSGSANITVREEVLSLAVTGNELPDVTADPAGEAVALISFTLAATGDSAIPVSAFTFSAADLAFSVEPSAGVGLNQVLELLTLNVAGSPVSSTAAFAGTDAVVTLAEPLVVEPGSPVTVVLHANATAALSGELAIAAFAAIGFAALGLRRRRLRLAALLLVLLIGLGACASNTADPEPVTASFSTQLTSVNSDANEISGLPLDGAKVTITY